MTDEARECRVTGSARAICLMNRAPGCVKWRAGVRLSRAAARYFEHLTRAMGLL
ncbi:MAG: hypothetical protein ACR2GO_02595 [Candidatus Limnocylindria bacterium]